MQRVMALLASAAFLGAACQPPSGPSAAVPSTPMAAADARLFAGHYDAAEAAYRALANGGDSAAHAHLAVLLDYENRFGEAVSEARAATRTRADSASLARLTRALDWSEDLAGALAAGKQAVTVLPVDPIAHVYYSEALADSGYFAAARAEIRAGEAAARDSHTVAEVEREWSNYYRGKADPLEELNHLELAVRAEPGFPERSLELARYQYALNRAPLARSLLEGLRRAHAGDYGVTVAAGDSAFLNRDLATAERFYTGALALRPNAVAASLGEAELDVSSKRDFSGAHDLLLGALRANPASAELYNYLYHLDLLVLKTEPATELAQFEATRPALVEARGQALQRANAYRVAIGLPALTESAPLAAAALAHAYFWLFNLGQAALADVKIHDEDPSLPGAVGKDSLARAQHFGYTGQRSAEVISHVYQPSAAIDHWVDTVFHRYPLSDAETSTAGYGEAQVGALSIQVFDLGQDAASSQAPIVYPVDGQVGVPAAFLGSEVPNPAPNARYPSGYPITIQVGSSSTLKITAAELVGPDGKDLNGYVIDPSGGVLAANQWAVLPREPLLPGGKYTMLLRGSIDGLSFEKHWSFTAAAT